MKLKSIIATGAIALATMSGSVFASPYEGNPAAKPYNGEYSGTIKPTYKGEPTFHFSVNNIGHVAGGVEENSDGNRFGIPLEGWVRANGDVNIFVGDPSEYKEDGPDNVRGTLKVNGDFEIRGTKGVWIGRRTGPFKVAQ